MSQVPSVRQNPDHISRIVLSKATTVAEVIAVACRIEEAALLEWAMAVPELAAIDPLAAIVRPADYTKIKQAAAGREYQRLIKAHHRDPSTSNRVALRKASNLIVRLRNSTKLELRAKRTAGEISHDEAREEWAAAKKRLQPANPNGLAGDANSDSVANVGCVVVLMVVGVIVGFLVWQATSKPLPPSNNPYYDAPVGKTGGGDTY